MVTVREQKLIDKGLEKGFLRIEDFVAEFSMNYWRAMIKKFLAMGLIKETEIIGKFDIITEEERKLWLDD